MVNSGISTFPSPEEDICFILARQRRHIIRDMSELEGTVFHLTLLWNWQENFMILKAKCSLW